ncbi:MAG: hypothetical protein RDV41_08700 [Planctomycetota bacterium]|nr:hypothetical protein [Planctomycetota bacterium]
MKRTLVGLFAFVVLVGLVPQNLRSQTADDPKDADALRAEIEKSKQRQRELEAEIEKSKQRERLLKAVLDVQVELAGKSQEEKDRLLFDRPRIAVRRTPLFQRVVKLCSEEGVQSRFFEMDVIARAPSAPLAEALVYGIAENSDKETVQKGFETILLDPDAMAKYPQRVRVAVVLCLMDVYVAQGKQPSGKVVEHVLQNDLSSRVRLFVLQELGQFGEAWYQLLSKNIRAEESDLRYGAMEGLQIMFIHGGIGAKELEENLRWMIDNEEDDNNRRLAVMMYGTHLKGKEHEDFLYRFVTDEKVHKRDEGAIVAAVDRLMACGENRERIFGMLEEACRNTDNPCSQEAAIGALAVWPDDRRKALDGLERVRTWAREMDEKLNPDKLSEELLPKGQYFVPLLQKVDEEIVGQMRFVPDVDTVEFIEKLMYESPFSCAQAGAPGCMVECLQDDNVEAILKKAMSEHSSTGVASSAMHAYSLLKGMEADDFLKQFVVKTRDDLKRKDAIRCLGRRGYDFGPRCKALEALQYLRKIEELAHLRADIDSAIANAEAYAPENFAAFLDGIEKTLEYSSVVWADSNPDNPAAKAGMESERGRQRAKALRGLYDKFFEIGLKERREGK